MRRVMLWSVLFLLLLAGVVEAQLTTAMLSGIVRDQAGAVVAGAEVTAINTGTHYSRSAKTNQEGEYRIEFLPVGSYEIEVTAQGFSKSIQKGIVLEVNQSARLDAVLAPGTVREVVEVTSAAPLVNTVNAEIGQTVSNIQIQQLPLVNRNAYNLLDITPGVQTNNTGGLTLGFPEQRALINGGTDGNYTGTVNYYLDGGTNMTGLRNTGNALPNPDAIQEFRVQTNAYSAEYGRFANGVVNAITKSGTNDFHGTAYEFWRNDALNAKNWNTTTKGALHRNQFGFTFGGPIKKDKTFFFGSYAGLRQVTSTSLRPIVPTEFERAGDFRLSATKPKDPLNGNKAFSCNGVTNVICPNRFDPVAVKILKDYIPLPTLTPAKSGDPNWQGFQPNPYNSDDVLAKIDHQLTPRQLLSGSFFTTAGLNIVNGGSSNVPWSRQQFTWRQVNVNLSDTYTINPSMVNQTWLVYSRMFGGRLNIPGISLADLGSTFMAQGTPSLPQITVAGYFTLGSAIAGPVAGTNFYSLRDVFSLTSGRHTFKFGGELSMEKDVQQTLLNNYGVFNFTTSLTGNAFANFLLGMPNSVSQDSPVSPATGTWDTAWFVQDDFRLNPRLTLNMGLRGDVQTSPKDPADRQSTFIAGKKSVVNPAAPTGMLFPGDPGVPRGIVPLRWGHVSPRFGFAYDPTGSGKTSIRGAAGIFWGTVSGNEWNQTSNFQPFATRLTFTNAASATGASLADPYRNYKDSSGNLIKPFPYNGQFTPPGSGGSVLGVSPGFDWPYTYQLNLSVQRQVTGTSSTSVAYVGSISHNLPFTYDLNYPALNVPGATTSTANVQLRRPDQNFGAVSSTRSDQAAWYHSLQITANKRMSHGVNFTTSYVFSKTLCTAEVSGGTTGVTQNMGNMRAERGPCDSDLRHALNLALVFQADYYHGPDKVMRHLLNGWQLSPIMRLRSGNVFSVLNGLDANLNGAGNDRASIIGDPHLDHPTADMWFNTAAFLQNPVVTGKPVDGSSPRNFLTGPGSTNIDMALSRVFQFTERYKAEFRGEATNVFNIVNLNNPGATMGNAQFGKINGAGGMRQLQLGLKLLF